VDLEIKAPPAGDARLPYVVGFIVLLGAQGRVAEVLEQQIEFPIERALDLEGRLGVFAGKALRKRWRITPIS